MAHLECSAHSMKHGRILVARPFGRRVFVMKWERAAARLEGLGRFTTGYERDGLKVYDAAYKLLAFAPFDYLEFREEKKPKCEFRSSGNRFR